MAGPQAAAVGTVQSGVMADRDILFAVRNNFYIGAYNNAINEASDMEGLSEAEQTERDVYVYRSYIALGSHDVSPANMQC